MSGILFCFEKLLFDGGEIGEEGKGRGCGSINNCGVEVQYIEPLQCIPEAKGCVTRQSPVTRDPSVNP